MLRFQSRAFYNDAPELSRGFFLGGQLPGAQNIHQDTYRINVCLNIGGSKAVLLRRGVALGSQENRVLCSQTIAVFRGVHVQQLDNSVLRQLDVGGLDVPVHDRRHRVVECL